MSESPMNESTTNVSGAAVRARAEAIRAAGFMLLGALRGPLEPAHLVFALAPSRSHILWLTGHIATSVDFIGAEASGEKPVLPEGYRALFGMGTQPVADAAAYPPLDELLDAAQRAFETAVERALTLRDDDLGRELPKELPVSRVFPTVGDLLTGAAYHTAYHTGQISMLRRAQGLATGLGV